VRQRIAGFLVRDRRGMADRMVTLLGVRALDLAAVVLRVDLLATLAGLAIDDEPRCDEAEDAGRES